MKTKLIASVCVTAVLLTTTPAWAGMMERDPAAVGTDALVGRPLCFAATVIGAAAFVVTLPFSVPSHSVGSTADSLVVAPAKATFVRPLGDFSYDEKPSSPPTGPQFQVRGKPAPTASRGAESHTIAK